MPHALPETIRKACAAHMLRAIEAEFIQTSRSARLSRQILVRLAEKALGLTEWDVPTTLQATVDRLKRQLPGV